MEVFETILGLVMIYAWIHGTVVIFNKIENLTNYEKVVLWAGFVAFVLFVIGSVS